MKIALGQIDMVWEEKEQSFQKAEQMIKEAAKKRADVILFPEMAFTGFSLFGLLSFPVLPIRIRSQHDIALQTVPSAVLCCRSELYRYT